jgi:phospholipase/carboxylesterase
MGTATDTVTGWPHLYRPGSSPDAPVLLMLHGTGSNEQDIAGLAADLDPDAAVLAPRGKVTEHGMLRWFRRHAEGVFDVDDVTARAGQLACFIDAAVDHYGIRDRRLIAVGFSNGANIALATALLHPRTLDRVIAFAGMYPLGDRDSAADLTGSRILILNGDSDPMAPLASISRLFTGLSRQGTDVEQLLRPGGHGITPTDLAAANAWLTRQA